MILDNVSEGVVKYLNGPGIDNKLRMERAGNASYFLADHLGSTNGLTGASGNLTSQAAYDSFGNQTGNIATRYGFTGRERDDFTGLMHYRARQYDPNLGRFISEDPIGFAGGINLYAYVSNSPVNFADPHGYFPSIYPLDYHQRRIGRNALIGIATPWQIEAINWANGDFDMRTQDPIYAPYHAMRRPGQTIDDARGEANDFVRRKICLAREYASRGWNTDAMHELGKAAHTMQDAASPSHAGFQEAWPNTYLSTIVNGWHYIRESVFPGAVNLSAAQENTKKVWSYFQGSSMPNDFFGAQSNSTSCGCER